MTKTYETYLVPTNDDLIEVTDALTEQGYIMAPTGITPKEWAAFTTQVTIDSVLVVDVEGKAVLLTNEADMLSRDFNETNEQSFSDATEKREIINSYKGKTDRITFALVENAQDFNSEMNKFEELGYTCFSGDLPTSERFDSVCPVIVSDSLTKQLLFADNPTRLDPSGKLKVCAKFDRVLPYEGNPFAQFMAMLSQGSLD